MAGMLPGVESARRRRFPQSGGGSISASSSGSGSTRRSSFCLYASNHETHLGSSSSMKRGITSVEDEKLGEVAREAKERLDEKLRAPWKTGAKRNHQERGRGMEVVGPSDLHTEIFGPKKSGPKKLGWAKLRWKVTSSEEEECAVCLEQFKAGQTLAHLPCAHRFHSRCLVPWLERNAQCPCCRMGVFN